MEKAGLFKVFINSDNGTPWMLSQPSVSALHHLAQLRVHKGKMRRRLCFWLQIFQAQHSPKEAKKKKTLLP